MVLRRCYKSVEEFIEFIGLFSTCLFQKISFLITLLNLFLMHVRNQQINTSMFASKCLQREQFGTEHFSTFCASEMLNVPPMTKSTTVLVVAIESPVTSVHIQGIQYVYDWR